MRKQLAKIGASKYFRNAAMYQPNKEQLRRLIVLVLLLLTVFVIASLIRAHTAGQPVGWVPFGA